MPRYVAFLRGINVGGHRVKMDVLRAAFEELDLAAPTTILASGNVVFDSDGEAAALEVGIEGHLAAVLGYAVPTFLRTLGEVAHVAAHVPFADEEASEGDTLQVGFLRRPPSSDACTQVVGLGTEVDRVAIEGRELYWRVHGGLMETTLDGPRLGELVGTATFRNVTTVRRLAAKHPPS